MIQGSRSTPIQSWINFWWSHGHLGILQSTPKKNQGPSKSPWIFHGLSMVNLDHCYITHMAHMAPIWFLNARPKIWLSNCRSLTVAFRFDGMFMGKLQEFHWVSRSFLRFHGIWPDLSDLPDEFLFWMVFLSSRRTWNIKCQLKTDTGSWKWTRLNWCHLIFVIQESIDYLWTIKWSRDVYGLSTEIHGSLIVCQC